MAYIPIIFPTLVKDTQCIERVQRRFTIKRFRAFSVLSFAKKELGAHMLAVRRTCADAVLIHQALHGGINYPACDLIWCTHFQFTMIVL